MIDEEEKEVRQQAQVVSRGTSDQHQVPALTSEAEEPRRQAQPAWSSKAFQREGGTMSQA